MKLKKLLALVLALCIAVTCFAGCASKTTEEPAPADDAAEATVEETTEAAEDAEPAEAETAATEDRSMYPGTPEANSITLDLGMEPTSINSLSGTYNADFKVMNCLLSMLFTYDENANAVPCTVDTYEASEDSMTYTLKLKEGLVWSNGYPLTANDYAFAWKMLMTPDTGAEYAYFAYTLFQNGLKFYNGECDWEEVGVKVIDDLTLEITLENPTPYVLSLLTFPSLGPVNEQYYTEVGADNYFTDPEYTIACGAYTLDSWTHDSELIVKKNETYFDADKVSLDQIIWKMYTQSDTRFNAFKAGELDVIQLTGDQRTELMNAGFPLTEFVEQTEYHILFNCEDEYMSNVNLRKAFDLAYSRTDFVNAIKKDASQPANTFVPPAVNGFDGGSFSEAFLANEGVELLRQPDAQKELAVEYLEKALEELGCTREDLSAHIVFNCGDSDTAMNQSAFLQEAWRTVLGVEVQVKSMTTKALSAERGNGNFVIDFSGWGGDYNDPMTWLDLWETGAGNNSTKYSNAEYDECLNTCRTTTDLEARQKAFYRCEELIAEECPISSVYWLASSYAISDKITGGYLLDTWQNNFRFATVK